MAVVERVKPEPRRLDPVGLEERLDVLEECRHRRSINCDGSHRQAVIEGLWRCPENKCEASQMAEVFDMATVRAAIERIRTQRGLKRATLAKMAGLGPTAIRDIEEFDLSDVKGSTLVKVADVLDVSVDALVKEPVYLAGKVGAGGAILFEASADAVEVPRPPTTFGPLVALEVVGDSMFPKYEDGDVVYVRRDHEGVLPEYLGEHCVVHTADGGTFLKILTLGSRSGTFTLRSHNAADMPDVEVVWATPVLWVMPKRSRPR